MNEIEDMFGEVPQREHRRVDHRMPLTAEDIRQQMLAVIAQLREANHRLSTPL